MPLLLLAVLFGIPNNSVSANDIVIVFWEVYIEKTVEIDAELLSDSEWVSDRIFKCHTYIFGDSKDSVMTVAKVCFFLSEAVMSLFSFVCISWFCGLFVVKILVYDFGFRKLVKAILILTSGIWFSFYIVLKVAVSCWKGFGKLLEGQCNWGIFISSFTF